MAPVAINGGHVRPGNTVVLEMFVKRLHAHGAHPLRNQIADGVIRHCRCDPRPHSKAIGQVGRHVEFATAHVNLALRRLAKRNDSRIKPDYQRSQRQ